MARINDIRVSDNFKLYEFECNDGNHEVKLDPDLLDKLQALRTRINKPIYINSAYRTPDYNKKVGGSPTSQHLLGKACDIKVYGMNEEELLKHAKAVGFTGLGLYNKFIHVDVREKSAYWDYRR